MRSIITMPGIILPPFVQYQQQLPLLKGNWNRRPKDVNGTPLDDAFVSAEIDWLVGTNNLNTVQFNVAAGAQPLSQIAALVVDNSRCGADVAFIFPDTNFEIVVAARTPGGIYPVLSNATNFFASAVFGLANTDITILQICNTVPPPLALLPSTAQNRIGNNGVSLVNGTTQVVAAGQNGTVASLQITGAAAAAGTALATLQDGGGRVIWSGQLTAAAAGPIIFSVPNINARFTNGLQFIISGSTLTGTISVNAYYTQP